MDFGTWPPLLVVDVEGNGASPPDLVEVAALPVRGGEPDTGTAGWWLIRPPRPVTRFAARVHGLTDEVLASRPSWHEVAGQVRVLLGGVWIAAHNAHVDHRVLSAHLPGWEPAGVVDTLRLARAARPGLPSYTLDSLVEHLAPGLRQAPDRRHRARFDSYATSLLLLDLAKGYETWDQLAAVAVPPGLTGVSRPDGEPTLW
ncbi:3'-5' exonuclease [Streptomyces sp. NRRL F-5123]|uniref:3'-5' exonuclease n=1 Tax=Streptomyces sp. NRRL F-5123 TaxID=1463856 RepID=UPI0004E0C2DD|nr:3'-5' exonuclease [Streptomyces sp. NRRL F-5123]